jgi:hypothetical protein
MIPDTLEEGDRISIQSKPLCGPLWKVKDVEVEDLGITAVTVVALYSDDEVWTLQWTDISDKAKMVQAKEHGGKQYKVHLDNIDKQ